MEQYYHATIIGATGLVGRELLQELISSPEYRSITVLTRKATGIGSEKVTEIIIDFDRLNEYSDRIQGDHAFCCLGTTMKKAGSKASFRKVDYDYVLAFAKLAHDKKVPGFSLVSSLGASKKSMVFYSRVKGEIEEAVSVLGFETVNIFRPSLLLGDRQEKRAGEDIAKVTYKLINAILPSRYKGIQASTVAKGMLKASLAPAMGITIYPSEKIHAIGQ